MPRVVLTGPELEENLGLRYLAASLENAGISTDIVPFNSPRDLRRVLEHILSAPTAPMLVAVSLAFQWRAMDFLALAVALRERGYRGHITAGGHFGTFRRCEILRDFPEIDSICLHEAEETIVKLATAIGDRGPVGEIDGISFRDSQGELRCNPLNHPPDLASLPWPDRRGEPTRCLGHRIAAMVSSRGCYANCAFCCIAAWHEQMLPGKRYRMRPVASVADEMAWLHRQHHIDIFIFHDDNFFLPGRHRSLERIHSLADALETRGVGKIGTVVKARPTDVSLEVFRAMKERLGCIRLFLGIETDSEQGLATLHRCVRRQNNREAMRILRELELYVCFNMLVFDPDTTVESLETNLAFMEEQGDYPFNFGRVELYAGTPLLARMEKEARCTGDYLGHDYQMASLVVQRTFELAMQCFHARNFSDSALANRLMGTRFDVEVCRFFHSESYRPEWLEEARALSRRLARDSVAGMREIVAYIRREGVHSDARELVADISARLRNVELEVRSRATALEERIRRATGRQCMHAKPVDYRHPPETRLEPADALPSSGTSGLTQEFQPADAAPSGSHRG